MEGVQNWWGTQNIPKWCNPTPSFVKNLFRALVAVYSRTPGVQVWCGTESKQTFPGCFIFPKSSGVAYTGQICNPDIEANKHARISH